MEKTEVEKHIENLESFVRKGSDKARYELVEFIIKNRLEDHYPRAMELSSGIDPRSKGNMGRIYRYGCGMEINLDKSIDYYRLAANAGLGWARNELSDTLIERNAEGDLKEAFKILEIYSREGDNWAKIRMARMYRNGSYVDKDVIKALEIYLEVREQGVERASKEASEMILDEIGTIMETDASADLLNVVEKIDLMDADKGEKEKTLKTLLDAFLSLDPDSEKIIRAREKSLHSDNEDVKQKSIEELRNAVIRGSKRAAAALTDYYREIGDRDRAIFYGKLSLKTDVGKNINSLIDDLVSRGRNDDYYDAYRLSKAASDAGDAWATWRLAKMYLQGQYVEKDYNKAKELLTIAADKGVGPAADKLRTM